MLHLKAKQNTPAAKSHRRLLVGVTLTQPARWNCRPSKTLHSAVAPRAAADISTPCGTSRCGERDKGGQAEVTGHPRTPQSGKPIHRLWSKQVPRQPPAFPVQLLTACLLAMNSGNGILYAS